VKYKANIVKSGDSAICGVMYRKFISDASVGMLHYRVTINKRTRDSQGDREGTSDR